MNRLVIFDLDGVLVDSRKIHFEALNRALLDCNPKYVISWDEHLSKYDGLPTTKKLKMLTDEGNKALDALLAKKEQEILN
jgi:beta-phosphoglucomutase-like phosphatase (HAD superfamily)